MALAEQVPQIKMSPGRGNNDYDTFPTAATDIASSRDVKLRLRPPPEGILKPRQA